MHRVVAVLILFFSSVFGGWCIQHAVQRAIHDNEDKIFFKTFPNGIICQDNGLYRFITGVYKSKKEAILSLKLAHKTHPDAFLKKCDILQCKNPIKKIYNDITVEKKQAKKVNKKEQNITANESEDAFVKKILQTLDNKEKENSYTLGFYEFLDRLFHNDYNAKNLDYTKQLAQLEALLSNVQYDWNIYGNVALRYSKFIDYDLATDKEFISDFGINIEKRLFDGGMLEKNSIFLLKKRLAKLDYLTAKDKLSLYGLEIYTQALLYQHLKKIYQEEYFNQKSFYYLVKERTKAGITSPIDEIDAKNDLLELKKSLLVKIYEYLYSDYLLRNSIELNITKPIVLQDIGFDIDEEGGLEELYKKAYETNKEIKKEQTRYALTKKQIKNSERAYLPIIDFSGSLFYEYKKDFTETPHKNAHGLNYNAGVTIKIPIYSLEARSEYIQRAKLHAVVQKNKMLDTMKRISKDIHRLYNENRRLAKHMSILQQQLTLMKEKMHLVKQRYLNGLAQYRDFKDALRNYLGYEEEKESIKLQMIRNSAQINILIGKQIFYGEN
ncbi:outer membrane protein [Nitratiruptor sp. YY08-26]|uniref:TolC family protein n=1 Tax=unclassified Nitratiruptor TaxID=2624044 RepID=UPI00191549F7|nr:MULTISPECIES: TolC family protein [unclassified Nitratiruptor]BCD62635.1 outer membrane protein [Nitratiruptor sp. YY08-13]BCD66571.1 outer membrane protein [Nitratiruptor sp. YY08-26]